MVIGVVLHNLKYYLGKLLYNSYHNVLALLAGVRKDAFLSNIGQIEYYIRRKPNVPFVLFLHGFTGNKELWLRLAYDLRQTHNVIIPDLIGHGASSKSHNSNYSIESYADSILELLTSLNVKSISFVGNSMGSSVAEKIKQKSTLSISVSVYLNPFGVTSEQIECLPYFRENTLNPFVVNDMDEYDLLLRTIMYKKIFTPKWIQYYLACDYISKSAHINLMFDHLVKSTAFFPDAKKRQSPIHVIAGRKDSVVQISCYQSLVEEIKGSSISWLENVGHLPMLEAHSIVSGKLKKILL